MIQAKGRLIPRTAGGLVGISSCREVIQAGVRDGSPPPIMLEVGWLRVVSGEV